MTLQRPGRPGSCASGWLERGAYSTGGAAQQCGTPRSALVKSYQKVSRETFDDSTLRIQKIACLHARKVISPRSPTHKPHPDFGGGEFDEGEVVGVVLLEACGDGSEVFDLIKEPLDEVPVSIEEWAEGGDVHPVRHRLDVGPGTSFIETGTERIAVVASVGEQDLAGAEAIEHIGSAAPVMRLTLGQLEGDRQAIAIGQRMDLGRQSAA